MATSWTKEWRQFKSPLRVVVEVIQKSRRRLRRKLSQIKRTLNPALRRQAELEREIHQQSELIRSLRQRIVELETEKQSSPITLPYDPPINGHGYGPRMISLAVNVAQVTGIRGAEQVLKIVFESLNIDESIPDFTTIRGWLQRLGVAEMSKALEKADDWIWIVDHSNQIGAEKVLVVLAIRACRLPPKGTPLRQEDAETLAVVPGIIWKTENVAAVYLKLAKQFGNPLAIVCDGAVELRDAAECLKNKGYAPVLLQDPKHKAANLFKALLSGDERFTEFMARVGQTRSAIQQTELSFLTPPTPKPKSRFMNLKATLVWAATVLWILDNPAAPARRWVTDERLEDKLDWVRSYAEDVATWQECQVVICKALTFTNEQGLFRGAGDRLKKELAGLKHSTSKKLAKKLVDFVRESERSLKGRQRLPFSTEILESCFARFKNLERQHSKGGFTSLLAAFPTLLRKATPETIKEAFTRVHVKDVKRWVHDNLGETLTSKRRVTNHAFRKRATNKCATNTAMAL